MSQFLPQRKSSWAAMTLLFCFIALAVIVTFAIRQSSIQFIPGERPPIPQGFADNPITRLYQTEVLAAVSGWTAETHQQSGSLHQEMGNLPAAVAHWEAVTAPSETLRWRIFEAYVTLEQWSEAAVLLSTLSDAGNVQAQYQFGLLLAAFDPLKAAEHLQAANTEGSIAAELLTVLQEQPADFRLGMRVGQIFAEAGLWQYAELAFRQAAIVNYPDPEALAYVGLARTQQEKSGDPWIQQALELGPDVAQVQYIHGLLLRRQGQFVASRDAFAKAIAVAPENPAYYAELGTAYRLLLDYEQAEYWLRVAVSVSQDAPEFQELLAIFYAEEGYRLPPESLESAQRSRQQLPQNPDLLAGIGWALHTMGDTTGGLNEIEAALELAPENPAALFYKARILADQGDLQTAVEIMERVARSNSEYASEAQHQIDMWTIGVSAP